jgi:hypothetical protein
MIMPKAQPEASARMSSPLSEADSTSAEMMTDDPAGEVTRDYGRESVGELGRPTLSGSVPTLSNKRTTAG